MDDSEKIRTLALQKFDVGKWKNKCNLKGCENVPDKEFFIHEYTIKAKKGLVTLYLCKDHHNASREFVRNILKMKPKMFIQTEKRSLNMGR